VKVLSSIVFAPLWARIDGWEPPQLHAAESEQQSLNTIADFFTKQVGSNTRVADFFPLSFGYHWHNQWHQSIVPGTWAAAFAEHWLSLLQVHESS
jgi:hypothetical protein